MPSQEQVAEIDAFRNSETRWSLLNALESHFVLPEVYGIEALSTAGERKPILDQYTPGTAELALVKSKGLDATEPKDKAYAMLWAFPDATEADTPLRQIDYDKPIEVIFTEFTIALVKMNGSSGLFFWVNSTPRKASLPP